MYKKIFVNGLLVCILLIGSAISMVFSVNAQMPAPTPVPTMTSTTCCPAVQSKRCDFQHDWTKGNPTAWAIGTRPISHLPFPLIGN